MGPDDGLPNQENRDNRTKKIIWWGIAIFISFASVVFYWFFVKQNNTPQQPAYSGLPEKIVIGNVGEYSIFNIIAQRKGFFKDNDLDAQVKEYASGPPAVADLLAGKVDVAIGADFVGVVNTPVHPELKIITEVSSNESFQVEARKDKGINTPADLAGKKIAVTKGGVGEFALGRFLIFSNLDSSSVQILNLTPSEIDSQLEQGTIDAAVIFEPHVYNLQKKLGSNLVVWPALGGQRTFTLLFSTNSVITAHSELINHYLAALVQAESYSKAHVQDTKNIVASALNYDADYTDYIWPKIDFRLGLDQELILGMESEARWAIGQKITDQTDVPNYLDSIYFDGLAKVDPSSINVVH